MAPSAVPVRVIVGVPAWIDAFGVRATVDYGRDSGLRGGTVALAVHATYGVDADAWRFYAGAGLGGQFGGTGAWPDARRGVFIGALVGAEYFLTPTLGVLVEGALDRYFGASHGDVAPDGADRGPMYPTIAVGIAQHF